MTTWTQRRLTVDKSDAGITIHALDSGREGPHLVVLGGVHGNEVGGIVAAGRIASAPWALVRGRLTVVPITHEAAYEADLRVSPLDGGNLARAFPGDQTGGPTARLAALVDRELIAGADVLIDLHTSSPQTDMPLFVGCVDDGTPQSQIAVRLAEGFGLDLVWTHPELGPGRTLTAAHERGIPALYVESPAGGVLDSVHLDAYVDGVRSVLEAQGMLDDRQARPAPRLWLHGSGDVDSFTAAPTDGLFLRQVALMDQVVRGQVVGTVLDHLGAVRAEIHAPQDGYVTTLRRSAPVPRDCPLVGVTPDRRNPE